MGNIFFEITVIICLAAVLAGIFRVLKQPAILAYILTGVIIAKLGFAQSANQQFLETLAQLGITFLLFMIGLEIKLKELPTIGKVASITAVSQIVFSFIGGFLISKLLGISDISSLYIGLAVTFSSTIVAVKLLSDKRDLGSLYGKIAIGVLLIQDFLAISVLIILSGFQKSHGLDLFQIALLLMKAVVIFGWIIVLSRTLFPKIIEIFAKSSETLFLISIAWVFGLSAFVSSPFIGFSIEIGGFLAGLALSNSIANYQIIAKVKILRDFFIILFFVVLGLQMKFDNLSDLLIPAIALSAFVLIGKPVIVAATMGLQGFRKRTSFLSGVTLSHVSEFSLILIFLGQSLGQVNQTVVSLVTLVGIITFVFSTYIIIDDNNLYLKFHKYLSVFERRKVKREEVIDPDNVEDFEDHVVVIGGDILGKSIIQALSSDDHVVVVDFDPNMIRSLESNKVHRLFGDITDLDIQERANLKKARLVISTIPDIEDNLLLLKMLNKENRKAKVVMMSLEAPDAKALYKAGADYVILPHLAGGRQIAKLIKEKDLDSMDDIKEKDLKFIAAQKTQ